MENERTIKMCKKCGITIHTNNDERKLCRMCEQEHNGWTNYETWLVVCWIDNEQKFIEVLKKIVNKKVEFEVHRDDELKEVIEEYVMGTNPKATLRMDLINSALSRVNWKEMVEHYKEYPFD